MAFALMVAIHATPVSAQTSLCFPSLQTASASLCTSPSQRGFWMTGPLVLRGSGDFVQAPGGYFGSAELGDPRDGAGLAVAPSEGIYVRGPMSVAVGSFSRARVAIAETATILLEGDGATDSVGRAVIVFSSGQLRLMNSDRSSGGGYHLHLTSIGPESVYWDRTASTDTYAVVRSASGRRAQFIYLLSAVPAPTPMSPAGADAHASTGSPSTRPMGTPYPDTSTIP